MSIERTLQMNFTTTGNKTYQISFPAARADLSDSDVNNAMSEIITRNIFSLEGGQLSGKKSARLVTREINDFSLV